MTATISMQSQTRFTLEDINKIKLKGFDMKLPENTIAMVNKLAQLVGSPEYVRTPVFKKRISNPNANANANYEAGPRRGEKFGEQGNNNNTGITEADWEALKNYKVTETVPKDRTEDEQIKRDIITELRKTTDKNYDAQKTTIMELLTKVVKDNYESVAKDVFGVCTGNKFYADVYANLYMALCEVNDAFKIILDNCVDNEYFAQFGQIKNVDPNEDYDLFCENNKQNELRVALSVFLMKILPQEKAEEMITKLLDGIFAEFNKKNNIYVVEQYSENVCEMVSAYFKKYKKFMNGSITESISNISMIQPRAVPSITNKIVFKFMDLEEILE